MTDDELFTEIARRDEQRQQALLRADIDEVERYLGSSLRYLHASAVDEDRALYLQRLRSGHYQYQNLQTTHRDMRRFGDTVLVNGEIRIHVIVKGAEKDFRGRYLQVWALEAGRWMMVAWQTTRVPAE